MKFRAGAPTISGGFLDLPAPTVKSSGEERRIGGNSSRIPTKWSEEQAGLAVRCRLRSLRRTPIFGGRFEAHTRPMHRVDVTVRGQKGHRCAAILAELSATGATLMIDRTITAGSWMEVEIGGSILVCQVGASLQNAGCCLVELRLGEPVHASLRRSVLKLGWIVPIRHKRNVPGNTGA